MKMKIKNWVKDNYIFIILFIVLCIVCVAVFILLCSEDYINYDSAYQYFLTQHSMSEIWELIPEDYSPPLYSILLKLFCMVFGHTLYVMRVFSIFPIMGMLVLALFPFRRIFGAKAGVLCALITVCAPSIMYITPEIRPTILAVFFMMGTSVYACDVQFNDRNQAYIALSAFTVLGMYTHNVAMLGALGIYALVLIYALIQKNYAKLKKIFISGAVSAVMYLPWLYVVFGQFANVKEHFWTSQYNVFTMLIYMYRDTISRYLFYESPIIIALKIAAVIILIRSINIREIGNLKKLRDVSAFFKKLTDRVKTVHKEGKLFFLFLETAAPMAVLGMFHILVYPILSERYIYIYSGIYFCFLAAVMAEFSGRFFFPFFTAAVVANSMLCLSNFAVQIETATADKMIETINSENPDGDIVFLHLHEFELGTFSYYFPEAKHYVADETYTVLRTYDVFTADITEIGSIKNIWNYTDKFYLVTDSAFSDGIMELDEFLEIVPHSGYKVYTEYYQPYSYHGAYTPVRIWLDSPEEENLNTEKR